MKRRNAMLKSILTRAAFGAALVAAVAPVAATAGQRETTTVAVDVSDLNLSNPADRVRAERRVSAAVRSMCATSGARSIATRQTEAACREQALASIRPLGF
jgi:UrcA family protein